MPLSKFVEIANPNIMISIGYGRFHYPIQFPRVRPGHMGNTGSTVLVIFFNFFKNHYSINELDNNLGSSMLSCKQRHS